MGNSHFSSLIFIALIPGAVTGIALGLIGQQFEMTRLQIVLLAIPLWVLVLCVWVFGLALIGTITARLYRTFRPVPCCEFCDKPLATRLSQQCLHCGSDWHSIESGG